MDAQELFNAIVCLCAEKSDCMCVCLQSFHMRLRVCVRMCVLCAEAER